MMITIGATTYNYGRPQSGRAYLRRSIMTLEGKGQITAEGSKD